MEGQLTLSELNALVKDTLEVAFPEQLWLVAEIADMKINRTGHCYLELVEKDKGNEEVLARARATIWSWQFRFIRPYFETSTGQPLTNGLKVLVAVSVEFHEVYGFSLNIKDIDPAYTLGDMARKRNEIIERLTEEGIFDMNREIPFPDIPSRIAIISSPTAAGYEDFMNQLENNTEGYRFYTKLFAATMQGADSPGSVIMALDAIFEQSELFDVAVIIRGGGSQVDLNCFDDYELAMHIAQFPLPLLTGIGHEKDESVADMVAHTKLKTPTAVAEFLISKYDMIAEEIEGTKEAFLHLVSSLLNNEAQRLSSSVRLLKPIIKGSIEKIKINFFHKIKEVKPLVADTLEHQQFRLIKYSDKIVSESRSMLNKQLNRLSSFSVTARHETKLLYLSETSEIDEKFQRLKHLTGLHFEKYSNQIILCERTNMLVNPKNILKRGFSITLKNGKAVKTARGLEHGDMLEHILHIGKIKTIVDKHKSNQ
ncbi:MAG: exodeoxyribonuclease VII large subunit [Prolixibacteraceae bacterium]|nr:exodeoxyribonuclease VII large subunit [Prolixibacteraceae bacterium]